MSIFMKIKEGAIVFFDSLIIMFLHSFIYVFKTSEGRYNKYNTNICDKALRSALQAFEHLKIYNLE